MKDNFRSQLELNEYDNQNLAIVTTALSDNPSVLRTAVTPDSNMQLYRALRGVISSASSDAISVSMRGSDFLNKREMSEDEKAWLAENPTIAAFNQNSGEAIRGKSGRLGAVIATLPADKREEIVELIKAGKYTPNSQGQEHVARLLTHTNAPACEAFAKAVILNAERYRNDRMRTERAIPGSVDGNTAFQFWTYGPYVLEGLQGEDTFAEFMDKWAKKRQKNYESFMADATYPGIEGLYADKRIMTNHHYLAKDGNSLSHVLADTIAQGAILPTIA